MRNNKYKRMKKAVMAGASSGIVAGLLLMGSTSPVTAEAADYSVPAYTQSATTTGMHMMHRWNSPTKINALATSLGLDQTEVTAELKSGKNLKQILQENGIVPEQLGKAFSRSAHRIGSKNWKNKTSSLQ